MCTGTALSPPPGKRAVPQVSHGLEDNAGVQLPPSCRPSNSHMMVRLEEGC